MAAKSHVAAAPICGHDRGPRRCVDRLLKNQNPLENRNSLRSSPHPGPGQTSGEPRRNFAVRNSSTRKPWLFRSPVFGSGIRRLDGEVVGGPRTPPRRVSRWLATSSLGLARATAKTTVGPLVRSRLAPVRSLQLCRLMNTPTPVAGFDPANHGMPGATVMALAATISDPLVLGLAAAGRA